jgi:hypothetical protein
MSLMNGRKAFLVVMMGLTIVTVAKSGHEQPVYPSYYPHEIEIRTVAPEGAADLLRAGKIQAYVGQTPAFTGAPPASIGSVESLGAYVLVRVNPSSSLLKEGRPACSLAESILRELAEKGRGLIFHPYPVTPYHGDYLHHVDLAEAAKARLGAGSSAPLPRAIKVKAARPIAERYLPPDWILQDSDWDVEVAEVDAASLVGSAAYAINGWLGPAWLRTGWFHAGLLLGDVTRDENQKRRIEENLNGLKMGSYDGPVARINLERELVHLLTADCHALVAGYTVKREYFSTEFSAGIENIAYDSIEGFNSAMFIRTVKLKDFPWNGWLQLGIDGRPAAAWNPIAGFSDDFGRLMWSAVSDPAMVPSPYESAWMLNRISDVQSTAAKWVGR